ncbi:MAG TPA: hypothetical protein VJ140_13990 [Actinomycetota bacterium]|nr:hypothetical protein [Actinomycetota bacterium]
MGTETATVETLTAEVRVLMVGSRQVTLSVARQLDVVHPSVLEPFGRVNLNGKPAGDAQAGGWTTEVDLIGCSRIDGALVRSRVDSRSRWAMGLPLIVLAGLR